MTAGYNRFDVLAQTPEQTLKFTLFVSGIAKYDKEIIVQFENKPLDTNNIFE